jgi:hypothetical protein
VGEVAEIRAVLVGHDILWWKVLTMTQQVERAESLVGNGDDFECSQC